MLTNADCTLFHIEKINGEDVYQRKYFSECFWNDMQSRRINTTVNLTDDKSLIYLSEDLSNYVKPKAYSKLSDQTGKWTITQGDILIRGNIPHHDNYRDLKQYDDVRIITVVDDAMYGSDHMKHLELTAK